MKVKEFEQMVVLRMLGVGEREIQFESKDRSGGKMKWVRGGGEIKWSQKG